jgi:alkanesulfonate monooxygenase SsuD/methylene tetrahydromethanopterin reductase-like flavin-dependent oxidoreductase (luciferase family)
VAACAAATLDELAPGRTLVAIGSGDSAAYNIGARPASLAELREYAESIRNCCESWRMAGYVDMRLIRTNDRRDSAAQRRRLRSS